VTKLLSELAVPFPPYQVRCGLLLGARGCESWDDKQTGAKHYRDLVYVDRIEFLDSRGDGNGHRDPVEGASDETTSTDQEMPF